MHASILKWDLFLNVMVFLTLMAISLVMTGPESGTAGGVILTSVGPLSVLVVTIAKVSRGTTTELRYQLVSSAEEESPPLTSLPTRLRNIANCYSLFW